jgi:hypothetical protein
VKPTYRVFLHAILLTFATLPRISRKLSARTRRRRAKMPPTTPSQKALLSQFIAITGAPEKTAAKVSLLPELKAIEAGVTY